MKLQEKKCSCYSNLVMRGVYFLFLFFLGFDGFNCTVLFLSFDELSKEYKQEIIVALYGLQSNENDNAFF